MRCQDCGTPLDQSEFKHGHKSSALKDEDFGVLFVTDIFSFSGDCPRCGVTNLLEEVEESEISLIDYEEYLAETATKGRGASSARH
jgi:hypothetical protein